MHGCSQHVSSIFPQIDATRHRHVFKAFDYLSPDDVRVVLLGQDPYPNDAQATGRAFEQGDLDAFTVKKPRLAHSLNMMLRKMLEATVVNDESSANTKGVDLRLLLVQSNLDVVSPSQVFDHLEAQGVLFLNASLTIQQSVSRQNNGHLRSHLAFWRPFVQAVVCDLLARQSPAPVFLLMGTPARILFENMTASVSESTKTRVVYSKHPSANSFGSDANPFTRVNKALSATGSPAIEWLPASTASAKDQSTH